MTDQFSQDRAGEQFRRDPLIEAVERYSSTEHLSSEAIAAYVDNRLPGLAARRATQHLACCEACQMEVLDQREAQRHLRSSGEISMPAGLRQQLNQIPDFVNEAGDCEKSIARRLSSMLLDRVRKRVKWMKRSL